MKTRLIFAIVSTLLEEAAILGIIVWVLPQTGVRIPFWGLILIMVAWAVYSIFTYKMGTRALKREQVVGWPNMIGTKGKVISSLNPEGLVRIRGETWAAKSEMDNLKPGDEVIVVAQERLKLVVRRSNTQNDQSSSVGVS
jgi:membrane-bound ClpP family serine protease